MSTLSRLLERVPAAALNLPFAASLLPASTAFDRALEDPRAAQTAALQRIMSCLGGVPRYRALRGVERLDQLQSALAPQRYEDVSEDIEAMARGEVGRLSSSPLVRFERSGGSSGAHKLLPFTQAFLEEMQRALAPWLFDLYARHPGVARGCAYWSISPLGDVHRRTTGGTPIGAEDDTSYFPAPLRALLGRVMAAPAALGRIRSVDASRYATLRVLLEREDLSFISVWSPTFLSLLLDALELNRARLAHDLRDGTCSVDDQVAQALTLQRRPERAALLEGGADARALWPRLALVSLWTEGSSAAFVDDVARRLPGVALQPKGLLATEGVVSIPLRGRNVLAVSSHVLEFIDEAAPDARPRLVHELEVGGTYQVLLTTSAGLVRYRLGDRVEVTGALEATPTVRFIGRAGVVSDLVGEKLSLERVHHVLSQEVVGARFAMVAPAADGRGYLLFVEGMDADGAAQRVEQRLCEGHPYRYARELGQLRALRGVGVQEGARCYEAACIRRGQRAGDIKATPLHLARDWAEAFGIGDLA